MRIYQFLFYNPAGSIPAMDFSECLDDGAATREAFSQLGHHGTCKGVEVFEEDRLVIRLERSRSQVVGGRPALQGAG
jgi:hypothetical protein